MTYQQKDMEELALSQVDRLATFILREVSGEPSQNEGAIDCAIRIIKTQQSRIAELGKDIQKGLDYGLRLEDRIAELEAKVRELEEQNERLRDLEIEWERPKPKENER